MVGQKIVCCLRKETICCLYEFSIQLPEHVGCGSTSSCCSAIMNRMQLKRLSTDLFPVYPVIKIGFAIGSFRNIKIQLECEA